MTKFKWTKQDLVDARTDKAVMDRLVTVNLPFLWKQCYGYGGYDARELLGVATEAFMECVQRAKPYKSKNSFLSFCKQSIRWRMLEVVAPYTKGTDVEMDPHFQPFTVRYVEELFSEQKDRRGGNYPSYMGGNDYRSMFKEDSQIASMIEDEDNAARVEHFLSQLKPREKHIIVKFYG